MMRLAAIAVLSFSVATPSPALAATRRIGVGSFDRLRVYGPIEVRVATGKSPQVEVSGDPQAIERVEVRVDGSTINVRGGASGNAWGERPAAVPTVPTVVTLTTPNLVNASTVAGGVIAIADMKAPRVDIAMTGSGSVTVAALEAEQLAVTAIGTGTVAVAGRATTARLMANGPTRIDAAGLQAGDLTVRLEGQGEVRAAARYNAAVNNLGLGTVAVAGTPKCVVQAPAGGVVECAGKR